MRSFITESHLDRVKALERLYSVIEVAESHIKVTYTIRFCIIFRYHSDRSSLYCQQYEKGHFPLLNNFKDKKEEDIEFLRRNHHLDTKIVSIKRSNETMLQINPYYNIRIHI